MHRSVRKARLHACGLAAEFMQVPLDFTHVALTGAAQAGIPVADDSDDSTELRRMQAAPANA